MIHLDTHSLIRLGVGRGETLGSAARKAIERNELEASPAAVLGIEFLHEIGRLKPNAAKVMATLAADFGLRVSGVPFQTVVEHAIQEGWTCDPFDRLIVGNAKAAGAGLVTKDETMLRHYSRALW